MNNFNNLINKGILFDSHAHLNSFDTQDLHEIIKSIFSSEVKAIIDIATDVASSEKSIELAKEFKNTIFASVGIDPEVLIPGSELFKSKILNENFAFDKWLDAQFKRLKNLLEDNNEVYLIGETGMDNYWLEKNNDGAQDISLGKQAELFKMHIKLSKMFGLPLSIHSRNAVDRVLDILSKADIDPKMAIFHSLTPDLDDTEQSFYKRINSILERGFFIGLNGIVTYKSARILRNVVIKVIKERVKKVETPRDLYSVGFLLETDSPFLAPEGKRGEKNTPLNLELIFNFLTELLA